MYFGFMTPLNNLKASCRVYLLTVFKCLRVSIKFSFMSHPINHACFKSVTNSLHISPLAKNQMSRVFFRTKISGKKHAPEIVRKHILLKTGT